MKKEIKKNKWFRQQYVSIDCFYSQTKIVTCVLQGS